MRIASPSFIKKADRITNVNYLKQFVSEVELLYMASSHEGDAPDPKEVALLAETGMRFNIHLPYDVDLSKREDWDMIARFTDLLRPLNAYTHTIHIQKEDTFFSFLDEFTSNTKTPITVENSRDDAYLFGRLAGINAGICADLGHIIHYGRDVEDILNRYGSHIKLIHLHGTHEGRDHQSLKYADKGILSLIKYFAEEKDITVCVEVFGEEGFMESREILLSL